MDVFYSYTFGTAGWMALQGLALIIAPTTIAAVLSSEARLATQLEIYFSRSLGFSLLVIGVLSLLLTGSIPLSSRLSDGVTGEADDPKAPYAVPTLTVTMIYHSTAAFYCYAQWTQTSSSSFVLGMVPSGILAAVGIWCVLFGTSSGRISRKTGADKRTSGFPFKNAEADKKSRTKRL
ncbi:hypothetical protein BJ546DRAFT_979744 [Cryomyces antarcticus]